MPEDAANTAETEEQEARSKQTVEQVESADAQKPVPAGLRKKRRIWRGMNSWGISAASIFAVLLLWQWITAMKWVNPLFLPAPSAVWSSFIDLMLNGYKGTSLAGHVAISMFRLFVAVMLASVTAVPLGLISGRSNFIYRVIDPFIQFYRPLPPLAYYMLLIIWFGIDETSKVALLYLAAFAPLYLAAMTAVHRVPKDRILAAKTLGASSVRLFRYIILPSCLPELYTGFRTAVGFAYTTLVAAEMVAARSGVGWMVLDASKFLRSDIIFVGILMMGIAAVMLDAIIVWMQKKHVPWVGKDE